MQGKPTEHTPLPWELRSDKLVIPGTQKAILNFSIAWKCSAEYKANMDFVHKAVHAFYPMAARLASYEAALRELADEFAAVVSNPDAHIPYRSARKALEDK